MRCSIIEVRKQDIKDATELFIGNSSRFKSRKPGVVEMTIDDKFRSKNQLFNIAKSNAKKVEVWANERYGKKFSTGWVHIDQTLRDTVTARINMPSMLHEALLVKQGAKTVDQVNMSPSLFNDIGADFYMGDEQLRSQEMESDDNYYAKLNKTITNLVPSVVKSDIDIFHNVATEWAHDTTNDKDIEISDEILNKIINNKKACE
tara:strand:+ start:145 stop:756 length:612 start_codon:yes stop_codon:yes gene_type:complete